MTPHLSAAITLGRHCAAGGLVISAQSKKKLRDPSMKGEMEETPRWGLIAWRHQHFSRAVAAPIHARCSSQGGKYFDFMNTNGCSQWAR